MKLWAVVLFVFTSIPCFSDFSDHVKKDIGQKTCQGSIRNIDFIYLINLDKRPEKLEKCMAQLKPYEIIPYRFSAIYGWNLSVEAKNELGVLFSSKMLHNQWVTHFPLKLAGVSELEYLRKDMYGKSVFSPWMTSGAIGCYLSHFSVLQNAYDSGYETIWIMEDDIAVEQNPYMLAQYVDKLDKKVGKGNWDILYTDMDTSADRYTEENDYISDLKGDLYFFQRPDIDLSDHKVFAKRRIIDDDFLEIGSRMRTHSMIVRRSGMKKILDYVKVHHIFLPYDHELAIVPNIHLFNIRSSVVTFSEEDSDTQHCVFNENILWKKCKEEILADVPKIMGWYSLTRAEKLLNFLYEKQPDVCVELGAFGGSTTCQIAGVLSFLKKGTLYAIDAWDSNIAVEGMKNKETIKWWNNINMSQVREKCQEVISIKQLNDFCKLVHKPFKQAALLFTDGVIDFLYIDGSSSEKGSLEEVRSYFPKVKSEGYICIYGSGIQEKTESIAFLMKHCKWLKEESIGAEYVMFQKNK